MFSFCSFRAKKLSNAEIDSIVDRLEMSSGEEDLLHDIIDALMDDIDPDQTLKFNSDESDVLETILERCKEEECGFTKSFTA